MRKERISAGDFWADKLMDLANLQAVVLIFSQLVAPQINWGIVAVGVILYLGIMMIAKILRRR